MSIPTGSKPEPSELNLEQQRKRAKDLRRAHQQGSVEAAIRIIRHLPRVRNQSPSEVLASTFTLSEAQLVIAREAGFASWPRLVHAVQGDTPDGERLIDAALAGNDHAADAALQYDPALPATSLHAAMVLADVNAAFALLEANPALCDRPLGRRGWKPLLYLCSSRYQRGQNSAARIEIAQRLLALGAAVTGRETNFKSTHGTMLSEENELFAIEAAANHSNSPELVQWLLDAGADLNKTVTVLLQAVRGGNIRMLEILLHALPASVGWQKGWALLECVALNRKDMARMIVTPDDLPAERPLMQAIAAGRDIEMLDILLGNSDAHKRRYKVINNAYRCATRYAHHEAVAWLRNRGAEEAALTATDRMLGACMAGDRASALAAAEQAARSLGVKDHRALAWAVRHHHDQAIPLLIEAGINPNIADVDGEMPLHLAVRAGALSTAERLIEAGAEIDARNFDGETPLAIALALTDSNAREHGTRLLLDAGANAAHLKQFPVNLSGMAALTEETLRQRGAVEREHPELLFECAADAVVSGDLDALRDMLDDEPSLVHDRSARPHRATLLHYCGANGVEDMRQRTPPNAPAITRLLLERGADVNAICNLYGGGATTLGLALTSVHPVNAGVRIPLAEVLIRAGANLDGRGDAALARAAALGEFAVVQSIFEKDPPAQSHIQSAFMWACEFGRTQVVSYLIDKGADLSVQHDNGQTSLHAAAFDGQLEIVRLLIQRKAPLEIENMWGGTVLDNVLWAALNRDPPLDYTAIVEAIVKGGAKVYPWMLEWWQQETPKIPSSKLRIGELLRQRLP